MSLFYADLVRFILVFAVFYVFFMYVIRVYDVFSPALASRAPTKSQLARPQGAFMCVFCRILCVFDAFIKLCACRPRACGDLETSKNDIPGFFKACISDRTPKLSGWAGL